MSHWASPLRTPSNWGRESSCLQAAVYCPLSSILCPLSAGGSDGPNKIKFQYFSSNLYAIFRAKVAARPHKSRCSIAFYAASLDPCRSGNKWRVCCPRSGHHRHRAHNLILKCIPFLKCNFVQILLCLSINIIILEYIIQYCITSLMDTLRMGIIYITIK